MRRREFIGFVGGAAAGWPLRALAQPSRPMRRVGVLINADPNDPAWKRELAAFLEQMKSLGWIENVNFQIDYRNGAGDADRIAASAAELLALRPDVIVARSTPIVRALAQSAHSIPIVFLSVSDPIGEKFAASMAKPGGIMTGFTNVEASMGGKWVELLKEAAPSLKLAAILFNPAVAPARGEFYLSSIRTAAPKLGIEIQPIPVGTSAEIETAAKEFARRPDSALIVMPDPFIVPNRALVIELAARYRLPAIYGFRNMAIEGGLMSYGADLVDMLRRSAEYVDRILKGARTQDLPVQAPVKFDLVVNLKTAKGLGLKIPEAFLLRADELID
ncbi:ABC transporter substrate-binding protein [Rhodoplanes sp. Z2-YC6860]|uniref:ABC transporter substrate-binding protein n=1 Tax=Rhodoplanes sp. Z2-YC6860 TaxID=674703 RepID=UPI00078CADB9|nr:ABC transporter substrate-binding protein [Rhodoplanes sp. Z2-YC6860]AMN40612.1 ABC transporter substrate binding protein [Rhodoplanes sp. Z2-YC6860]